MTHAALLMFWGDKTVVVAPSVGMVRYMRRLEKIEAPISRIMQALHTHIYREQAREAQVLG